MRGVVRCQDVVVSCGVEVRGWVVMSSSSVWVEVLSRTLRVGGGAVYFIWATMLAEMITKKIEQVNFT